MKCPKCNGNKEIHTPIYTQGNPFMPSGWEYRTCEYCNGTGEVEQTNEEWFDSLSTEEKAKVLVKKFYKDEPIFVKNEIARSLFRWLKEVHTE